MTKRSYKGYEIEINRLGNRRYEYNVGSTFRTYSFQDVKEYINRQIETSKYMYAE